MFNNVFKLFSWPFVFRVKHRVFIHGISTYLIPCYFVAIITIIFQCGVESSFAVERYEMPKFSCNAFYLDNGLTESQEDTLFPILSDGIQSLKFSQYFVPEFGRSFCNSIFSIVAVSDIADKGSKQNSTQNGVDVVNNDFHLFGLPWWVWLIIIIFILTQR